MVIFVETSYGTVSVSPGPRTINNACLIGKVATIPGTNPFLVRTSTDIPTGLLTSDALYKNINYFLSNKGSSNAGLYCRAVSGAGTINSNVTLSGPIDGSNVSFKSEFAPVEDITALEINKDSTGWYTFPTGNWYTGSVGGTLDGSIKLYAGTGFVYSGTISGAESGFWITSGVKLRADITTNVLSDAYGELISKEFGIIAFAYDQSNNGTITPDRQANYKYASGYCIGGKSWLDDVRKGVALASALTDSNRKVVFFYSLPDSVRESTIIGTGWTSGTSLFEDSPLTVAFGDLDSVIGSQYRAMGFVNRQSTDGVDAAVMAMGNAFTEPPRISMMYRRPTTFSQTTWPTKNEVSAWRSAKLNPLIEVNIGTNAIYCWGNSDTFGAGDERDFNYVRCRDLFNQLIMDNLQALLATNKLKYNMSGIESIESVIKSAGELATLNGYIDGYLSVTIPIKSYVAKDGKMTVGDQLILDAARASKVVNNITVKYKWDGDIEELKISAITSE